MRWSETDPKGWRYRLGYRRWLVTFYFPARLRWKLKSDLPMWIALHLPKRVALMAFVRVYGVIGRCDANYGEIYHEWERRYDPNWREVTRG